MRTLCFGEAIVDLVCQRPVDAFSDADAFVPSPGGVIANVAATAAQHGAAVSLAGGAGDDPWGAWLQDRLRARGVDLHWFGLAQGHASAIAFATVDAVGEPSWQLYGDGVAASIAALDAGLIGAVDATDAFFFSSNTLVDRDAAKVTMAARERALERDRPIVFDPSVRVHRWRDHPRGAAAACGACVPGAFLVKCNQDEARLMTGEHDVEAAAASLLAAGARHVIVTLGARGAILRAPGMNLDVRAQPAQMRSAIGAGDVFLGVVIAHLGQTDYYSSALAAALPDAVEHAARACERWGALD
ncbi:MAG: PfkB family carbohydrate kinase [Solirubrobacteraceae bacterium]|nr:PfkB family carbohydrate kinase [Solirubrobacteraceae bacterium]